MDELPVNALNGYKAAKKFLFAKPVITKQRAVGNSKCGVKKFCSYFEIIILTQ